MNKPQSYFLTWGHWSRPMNPWRGQWGRKAIITLLLHRNVTDAENVSNALRCNVTAIFKI